MQSYFHGRATIIKARQKSKYRLLSIYLGCGLPWKYLYQKIIGCLETWTLRRTGQWHWWCLTADWYVLNHWAWHHMYTAQCTDNWHTHGLTQIMPVSLSSNFICSYDVIRLPFSSSPSRLSICSQTQILNVGDYQPIRNNFQMNLQD